MVPFCVTSVDRFFRGTFKGGIAADGQSLVAQLIPGLVTGVLIPAGDHHPGALFNQGKRS